MPSTRTLKKLGRELGITALAGMAAFFAAHQAEILQDIPAQYLVFVGPLALALYRTVRQWLGAEPLS